MRALKRRWKLVSLAALAVLVAAFATRGATAKGHASTIKIAVLSDCQGAFGSFDNQDLAGVVTAIAQFAGGKAKNPNKPRDGWTGASIAGHPLKLVGVGCGNAKPDVAIKETKRLMEQLNADVMIGPLSGDESIAVANYAKQHPTKTFVDGAAGAQDTTLKVRAPNFFRFNGDGAMGNAGLGDLAYNKLGWKTAAVVADDYSFAWTSAAGFIAEFCAVGGNVTKRVFPPLNTTDYSSYAQQMPTNVDGTFVAVGGAGLVPFLKAYEQAHGPPRGRSTPPGRTGRSTWTRTARRSSTSSTGSCIRRTASWPRRRWARSPASTRRSAARSARRRLLRAARPRSASSGACRG